MQCILVLCKCVAEGWCMNHKIGNVGNHGVASPGER